MQEYFETRILYGFYVYGDRLPSIQKLCVIFAMAPATIRSALGQLEKQGYIKVDARKGSEVIYQASPAKFRENAARYFGVRREGIADLFQSAELLFEPLWETRIIMSNGLAQNLYWEVIRYLRFPYLMAVSYTHLNRKKVLGKLANCIVFIPVLCADAVAGVVWREFLNGKLPVVEHFFGLFGIEPSMLLGDAKKALIVVGLVAVWKYMGYYVVIYLSLIHI